MDWHAWHDDYNRPDSALTRRLQVVQEHATTALNTRPPGPIRLLSLCAGQGRDVLEPLSTHPRRADVTARLVELDPRNTAVARQAAQALDLPQVKVVTGDAALTDHYTGIAPADLVLICGVFGNLSDEDIERTITFTPQLCAPDATLIWTRHRKTPRPVPQDLRLAGTPWLRAPMAFLTQCRLRRRRPPLHGQVCAPHPGSPYVHVRRLRRTCEGSPRVSEAN